MDILRGFAIFGILAVNIDIRSFYPRRTLALMGFGMLHDLLFREGDILRLYALLGVLLLAFRRCSSRTILMAAGACFISICDVHRDLLKRVGHTRRSSLWIAYNAN